AMTVRTYYMPNEDWQAICQQGRALREAAGTLTGHAAGHDSVPTIDHAAVARAIGAGAAHDQQAARQVGELPEPLASVVGYLGDDLDEDGRDFVPTADLVEALDVEPTAFGRQMSALGCRPERNRITDEDGRVRQIRGYLTADIRAALDARQPDDEGSDAER
ncbi:MAG: cell division protein FtsK, partial [Sciscionella sp.]